MFRKLLVLLAIFVVGMMVPFTHADSTLYSMKISFPGYTNRTDTLTNFPVLVVFTNDVGGSGFNYDTILSEHGYDLRFRAADNETELNYEIDTWNTNASSYVWVQIPELPTNGTGYIWVYWGEDDTQLACTTNGATWDAHYQLVWHLKESGNGTLNEFRDSTTNTLHGQGGTGNASRTPTQTDGQVAKGNLFDDTDDHIYIASGLEFPSGSDFTFEIWTKPLAWGGANPGIWRSASPVGSSGNTFNIFQGDSGRPWIRWNGNDILKPLSGYGVPTNTWTHTAYTVDSGAAAAFLANGEKRYNTTHATTTPEFKITLIGYQFNLDERVNGVYDELRFSTTVRSDDWLWATYMTTASNAVFSTYGKATTSSDEVFIWRTGGTMWIVR